MVGLPLTILEAITAMILISVREVIQQDETGYIVEPGIHGQLGRSSSEDDQNKTKPSGHEKQSLKPLHNPLEDRS